MCSFSLSFALSLSRSLSSWFNIMIDNLLPHLPLRELWMVLEEFQLHLLLTQLVDNVLVVVLPHQVLRFELSMRVCCETYSVGYCSGESTLVPHFQTPRVRLSFFFWRNCTRVEVHQFSPALRNSSYSMWKPSPVDLSSLAFSMMQGGVLLPRIICLNVLGCKNFRIR